MASVIKAGNATDGIAISSDNTGILELKTGTGAGTTAVTIGTDQSVTFAGAVSSSGNQTVTGNLTVNGNTTLGDANTDTILMTAAPSIGGAGLGMGFGFRNRIINGAMVIDQRNAGASVTPATSQYTLDRWFASRSQASKYSVQQNAGSVTPPAGFRNYLGVTSTSAYSVLSTDFFYINQFVEVSNAYDLNWGTANAQPVTLSFWVRSSLTGTFGGSIYEYNNGYPSYPFSFTISSANTWEYKTVVIPGPTSGTWSSTINTGLFAVSFSLGMGSNYSGTANSWANSNFYIAPTGATSVVGTNGATFYITGVQLEKGSTATSFDYRPYGTELQLCQRYFVSQGGEADYAFLANGLGRSTSTTRSVQIFNFPVRMRAAPTVATVSLTSTLVGASAATALTIDQATSQNISLYVDVASGLTANQPISWYTNNTQVPRVQYSSEL